MVKALIQHKSFSFGGRWNFYRVNSKYSKAVKILMAVVIGALLLAALYALFGDTVLPELTRRIEEMFNFTG